MDEVNAFVDDPDRNAYEHFVDRLLQRPAFGEHWARKWLDLARYADSSGYADDPPRTIWAYRDWVIRALNDNMPFDQFTIDQLAGDLLPNPSDDQLIATAFHRNTQTNNEGGTNNEEFRNVAIVDRVNTTFAVWMGTTLACAQCHHHKYDPISQEDYFRVFAILNNTQDADLSDDSPSLPIYTDEQKRERKALQVQVESLQRTIDTPTDALAESQHRWEEQLRTRPSWDVAPASAVRASGGEVERLDDQSLLVASGADTDTYTIDVPIQAAADGGEGHGISAVRLETLPDKSLPNQGSGFGDGNFVVTRIRSQFVPSEVRMPKARFVRVSLEGKGKILSLAEVQVFAGGRNIASTGTATQSSVDYDGRPELAIDGNTDGLFANKSVTHTANSDDPWWELDLKSEQDIERLVVWNRTDDGVKNRLSDFQVSLLDPDRKVVWQQQVNDFPDPSIELTPSNIREIEFSAALADYQQDQFPASSVLEANPDGTKGWAIGGATGEPHQLVLVLHAPLVAQEPGVLRLTVEQNSVHRNHLLGRFRLSTTSSEILIERAKLTPPILDMVDLPVEKRDADQKSKLAKYYREQVADELAPQRAELAATRKRLAEIQPSTSVLIMQELRENRRVTHLEHRGNYLDLGPEIEPGIPAALGTLPSDSPIDRLALAKWLVSKDNPLTARVQVNRLWETLFGRGLVATSEEFGSQGELPSHPELLDWLAVEFMESGWDVKHLLKLIVMSATYRQSSAVSSDLAERDRENRWLARGPRVRLTAEEIRDQALFVSGLLSSKMYGPPVRPPQPNFGLTAAFGGSTDWTPSEGEDRYRRAIYTTWRRSNPYPSMTTFDAPNREVCTIRRNRTNTPLQALVTLNDPVYVEASQALGRWMLKQAGGVSEQIAAGFRRCLLRPPSSPELQTLVDLYDDSLARLSGQPQLAMQLATEPLGPLPDGLDPAVAASTTVVGNVMLNLDEMFLKR